MLNDMEQEISEQKPKTDVDTFIKDIMDIISHNREDYYHRIRLDTEEKQHQED